MSAMVDFYLRRAADCARDARESNLVNVRERSLRAEAAWRAMADRLMLVEEQKRHDIQVKAVGATIDAAAVPWPVAPFKSKAKRED